MILTTETGREAGRSTGGQEAGTSPGRATPGQAEVTRGDRRRRGAPGPGLMVTVTPLTDMATPLMDTAILHIDTVTPLMALMDMEEVEEDPAMPGPGNPVQHLELEALTISVRFKVWSKTGPREEEYLAMEDSPSKRDLC